ncbi:choline transport ATP-binding protein OpuBA [Variibacter gotjawalensis]|uniref:Choline transport ATP-binding protein OpuBA n=1 Tax=Variibacter gotjawalensis TaxID=1333996 RepID=A0A0S3PSP8_9BRAD|nr:ABC transporter ATP-binding protein [Variibacter gotjawalensis]NIK49173.1 osmoprotectant transport system ATP-binding protein [Variibacter gotjawalensis]RZS51028.1 osmoprotectant transport system ATP-binding protein [Variibacter gotjawalensis]BAT58862.1 choline transport ATP-binding protein OpuBA [Variibacter gotjawalensis]
MSAPIRLIEVSKTFTGQRAPAIDRVNLEVAPNSFVALVGGSGSGKTTLLKCINRLVEPDAGRVEIEGRPASDGAAWALRRRIGYAFQNVGLFPHLTVGENIAITPRLLGWEQTEIAARVSELLALVNLPADYARRSPDALSGGERQRVGVARAIAARPSIVLMDEPFGALDPITREALGEAYRALHDKLGLTTVMVTHDVQEAVLLADRIVVIRKGRIVADDTPRTLLAGHPDAEVATLMAAPRRQAERVQALIDRERP